MDELTRRRFLGAAGAAAVVGAATGLAGAQTAPAADGPVRILAVSCSPRKGKTTAAGLTVCLEEAARIGPRIQTELIELAGRNIPVFDPAATEPPAGFREVADKLADPAVGGILVGTPVYFSGMTSLCKAFLDHCMLFRMGGFALRSRVAGVLAVGGVRNGGQELAIESVQAALLCQEMIVVGDGRPTAHTGATLLNTGDSIAGDEFGLATARNLGRHVAEVALRLAHAPG